MTCTHEKKFNVASDGFKEVIVQGCILCRLEDQQKNLERLRLDRARSINTVGSKDEADYWHGKFMEEKRRRV